MHEPTAPSDEKNRLAALRGLDILDTAASIQFDDITELAAAIFEMPIALISLVDADRQWFKSKVGLEASQTGRNISFCAHAILQDGIMVVPDASQDIRFHDNPLVCGQPEIRFYVGRPLRAPSGYRVGTLCLIDRRPRQITPEQLAILDKLGNVAERELAMYSEVKRQQRFNDTKSMLISSLSHELRTPTNALLGNLHLLQERSITSPDRPLLAEAVQAAEHIGRMLGDMVDLAQFEADLFRLETRSFDLHAVLKKLEATATEQSLANGLDFEMQLPDHTPRWLQGNPSRVYQMLSNLVENAIQYTLHGGIRLDIESTASDAEPSSARVLFRVSDTGIGIQPDQLKPIFEPFTRGNEARKLAPNGYGLGLTIARKLAILMNGDIRAHSDGKSGSTLTTEAEFILATPPPQPAATDLFPADTRLLLVEDSPANRMVIQAMLASAELPVEVAQDGEQALALAASADERFTMVLMDLDLPGIGGLECAQRLRQMPGYADVAIIAISAGMPGASENVLAESFSAYLPKPFQKSALLAALHKLKAR